MSMLAEPKRKQKWSLNPRGNEWCRDNNKFGQKLMERMGWKEGKGLGRNEDGDTQNIHIAYKNDAKGIGFKESIEWSHQQDNFSTLLQELNNSTGTEDNNTSVKSLEENSEKSRARVHYRKFTRGKDLSRYSKKDLANILGRSKLASDLPKVDSELENKTTEHDESLKFGMNTSVGGSMLDYFKNKLSYKYNMNKDESEEETNYGFGFNTVSDTTSKKKRKHDNTDLDETLSKKKHKTKLVDGVVNPAFDPLSCSFVPNKSELLGTICENEVVTPKPGKRKTKPCGDQNKNVEMETGVCVNPYESNKSKKKKEKSKDKSEITGIINPCCNIDEGKLNDDAIKKKKKAVIGREDSDLINDTLDSEDRIDLKKNKHTKKNSLKNYKANNVDDSTGICFDNPCFSEIRSAVSGDSSNIENPYEIKVKKKSKKHKVIENPCYSDETNLPDSCRDQVDIDEFEVKLKKKRKKLSKGIENSGFTADLNVDTALDNHSAVQEIEHDIDGHDGNVSIKHTKKKKNKRNQMEEVDITKSFDNIGVDNPGLNLNDSLIEDTDLILNVVCEPVVPKSVDGRKRNKNVRFSNNNTEYVYDNPESPNCNSQRKQLYNINEKVIQASSARYKEMQGLDNAAFNLKSNTIEESVSYLQRSLDNCQAEVENGINESKIQKLSDQERMIGDTSNLNGEDEPHPDGVVLRLKNANFTQAVPHWQKQNNMNAIYPKKSYKHLIKGDIIVGFKDSNLHTVKGYGKPVKL